VVLLGPGEAGVLGVNPKTGSRPLERGLLVVGQANGACLMVNWTIGPVLAGSGT